MKGELCSWGQGGGKGRVCCCPNQRAVFAFNIADRDINPHETMFTHDKQPYQPLFLIYPELYTTCSNPLYMALITASACDTRICSCIVPCQVS